LVIYGEKSFDEDEFNSLLTFLKLELLVWEIAEYIIELAFFLLGLMAGLINVEPLAVFSVLCDEFGLIDLSCKIFLDFSFIIGDVSVCDTDFNYCYCF